MGCLEVLVRYLHSFTIIHTGLLVALILALSAINVFVWVRLRKSRALVLFQVASGLMVLGFMALLMGVVTLDLWFDGVFRWLYGGAFACALLVGLGALIIAWGEGGQVTNLVDLNLKTVFAQLPDLVIIADHRGQILDVNVPERLELLCKGATTLEAVEGACNALAAGDKMAFKMEKNPIVIGDHLVGYAAYFKDITAIVETEHILERRQRDLEAANEKLKEYVIIAGTLEAEEARLQLLEDVQKGLVVTIEAAIGQIARFLKGDLQGDSQGAPGDQVAQVANLLRRAYREVRQSVRHISGKG